MRSNHTRSSIVLSLSLHLSLPLCLPIFLFLSNPGLVSVLRSRVMSQCLTRSLLTFCSLLSISYLIINNTLPLVGSVLRHRSALHSLPSSACLVEIFCRAPSLLPIATLIRVIGIQPAGGGSDLMHCLSISASCTEQPEPERGVEPST